MMTFFIGNIEKEDFLLAFLDKQILGKNDFWHGVYSSIFAILDQNSHKLITMNDISDVAMFF